MSSTRSADPRRLDVRALIDQGLARAGTWPVAALERLGLSLAPAGEPAQAPGQDVAWAVQGEARAQAGSTAQHWMRLRADADLALVCQRCLGPVREHVVVDRWLRFVADESQAARLDEELEDDVLALPQRLDLIELIEDELLLALPLVPRHAVCPQPLSAAPNAEDPSDAPHPFAALAALKRPDPG